MRVKKNERAVVSERECKYQIFMANPTHLPVSTTSATKATNTRMFCIVTFTLFKTNAVFLCRLHQHESNVVLCTSQPVISVLPLTCVQSGQGSGPGRKLKESSVAFGGGGSSSLIQEVSNHPHPHSSFLHSNCTHTPFYWPQASLKQPLHPNSSDSLENLRLSR